ncbi:MAG: ABC transporter substrate-binding protein [Spirochaetaceae bacterium]
MKSLLKKITILSFFLIPLFDLISETNESYKIYLNADMSGSKLSGEAIEMGINVALSEVNYTIGDRKIELVIKDHHGNSRRSLKYLEEFASDENALVTYTGLHSSAIINNFDYINKNGIPILNPWAAAGPISRSIDSLGRNWIFRLSVDDTKAGEVITSYSLDVEKFKNPILLLENTPWGKSNYKNMRKAITSRGFRDPEVIWFSWGIKEIGSKQILSDIYSKNNDVIFFVGNSPEGIVFSRAMSQREENKRIPIRSHWGITGGNFFESLGSNIITNKIDLKFIQTSFSFLDKPGTDFSINVFKNIKKQFSNIKDPNDLKAPNGFIHSYDLTRIFIEACKHINFTEDIKLNRELLRVALESVETPIKGLVKTYNKPFSTFTPENDSAHEALSIDNFRMARYLPNGSIEVINDK